MKTSSSKVLIMVALLLVSGLVIGGVAWYGTRNKEGAQQPPDKNADMLKTSPDKVTPEAEVDPVIQEITSCVTLLKDANSNIATDPDEINGQIKQFVTGLRAKPEYAGTLAQDAIGSGDADAYKLHLLALGLAHTEESKAALLKVILESGDSRMKMAAAAAFAMSNESGSREVTLPFKVGSLDGIVVKVGGVTDNAAIMAIDTEWKYAANNKDNAVANVFFNLLKASGPTNKFAAEELWKWATDAKTEAEMESKAKDVAASIKGNAEIQSALVAEVLNTAEKPEIRATAATVLREETTSSKEETKQALLAAAANAELDINTRGLAFYGMDPDTRATLGTKELKTVIGSHEIPTKIRLAAITEVRDRKDTLKDELAGPPPATDTSEPPVDGPAGANSDTDAPSPSGNN